MLEMLIVMALLLVLFTLYFSFAGKGGSPSRIKACQRNLQKIHVALDIFAADHEGKFPVVTNAQTSAEALAGLSPLYTVDTTVFICPGSGDAPLASGESFAKKKISYAYFMGRARRMTREILMSDRLVDALPKTTGQIAFSTTGKPPGNNHGKAGGNFLFTDGHTETTPAMIPFSLVIPPDVVLLNP
jgi:prepilin-type processing-associated H-X9-DG protein